MDDMVGDLGDPRMGVGWERARRGSRGLLIILSTLMLVAWALALAPLAQAAGESSPEVQNAEGGFKWESQGFAEEWGYVVAISRCSDASSCHPEEFKVEKIPGIQSYVPYLQNITTFTPEGTEVWVGIAVLPKRNGTHLAYRPTRVKVPLQELSETHGLEAPRELWAEGAVVNWSGVGEEVPNLDYKVAVSNEPRFCSVKGCRDTHYVDVPVQAGRSYSPCIGHLGYLGFAPEPTTVYVGVAALKFKNQPGKPIYTGSEVAVKPPRCPPPNAETTTPVSSVTQSSALLAGHVDPLGTKGVACYFEYATGAEYQATAKYGHKEECLGWSQGEGPKGDDVYMPIGGLAPETTYHFRLFAPGPVQIGNGASPDKTFTTLETPHPPPVKHPPVDLAGPVLSGTPIAGYNYSLTVTSGVWAYLPGYAYQWQRCDAAGNSCANIVGATANSLPLSGSDVGHRLRSIVTATNADGSAQAPSGSSAVIGSTVGSRARWAWERPHTSTRVVSLKVAGIPVGGALELTCRGDGCPFHSRKINLTPHQARCRHRPCKRGSAGPRTQVTLAYPFGHGHFRPGTVLGARVTRAGWAARVSQFTIRGKAEEEPVEVCLIPSAPRAAACPS